MMCEQGECCAPSGGTGTTAPPYRGGIVGMDIFSEKKYKK